MSKKLTPAKKKSVVEYARKNAPPKERVRIVMDVDENGVFDHRIAKEPNIPKNWKR